MDWNQIVTTFLTVCVPALISYLTGHYQTKSKITELKLQHEHEYRILKEKTQSHIDVLKAQAESASQSELTTSIANFMFDIFGKMMTGEANLDNLKKLEQFGK